MKFKSGFDKREGNWIYGNKKFFPEHAIGVKDHKNLIASRSRAMSKAISGMNEENKFRYIVPNVRMVAGKK